MTARLETTLDLVRWNAARYPQTPFLNFYDEITTYRDLEQSTNRFAHYLLDRGVRRGDVVSYMLGNSPAVFQVLLGTQTIGAIGEVGDRSPLETAASLADKLGAEVVEKADSSVDLLVVGSQQLAPAGRVSMTAAAQYVVETSRCPVLVLARGKTVRF